MRIKKKLEIGFSVVILMLALVVGLSAWLINRAQRTTAHLESTCLQQMELARLLIHVNRQMKELGEYIALGGEDELAEFQRAGLEVSSAFDQYKRLVTSEIDTVSVRHQEGEARSLIVLDNCQDQYLSLMGTCREIIELVQRGKNTEALELQEYTVETAYEDGLKSMIEKQLQYEKNEIAEVDVETWAFFRSIRSMILTLVVFTFVCAGVTSRIVTNSIADPLLHLQKAAVRIGQGQLDTQIDLPGHDEMGELATTLNQMAHDLKQTTASRDDLQHEIAKRQKVENDLEVINEELSQFAYVVSHDLKAPLRGIKMITQYLREDYGDKLGDQGAQQIDLLRGRVGRMYDLIEGVLQYSRVGCVQEDRTDVDLNELIDSVIDMIAPPEHVNIVVEGPLPELKCEKTRITQVFQNLLSNAVKYMDKSEGRIVIACSEDQKRWTFRISDNGPGIEVKHFDRIFQIFQTLTSRDQFESTGVGLTLVKKIVESYGGKIWVESDIGQGSTFFFTFPKQVTEVQEGPAVVTVASYTE